jgi:asparagine synthetase B (glutamine-hydrolysing)
MHDVFFRAIARRDRVFVSGTPRYSAGHRIAADSGEGVFAEWEWDGVELHVRGDRYGVYPLFYFAAAGEICVSSSLVTLVAEVASPEPDCQALAAFLRLGFFLGDDTPIKNVRALPPHGHLVWSDGTLRVSGGPAFPRCLACSRDDAIDAFVATFRRAIRRRLRQDGRVLLPLSGGRDSRHILFALVEAGAPPDACVTVRPYPPRSHMDIPIAQTVARAAAVPHLIVEQSAGRVAAERRKNLLTHFCSDEHAHFLALADYLSAHASASYDGLGGDMLTGQSSALQPELTQLLNEERFEAASGRLFEGYDKHGIEDALRRLLVPDFYARVSRDVAAARVTRELIRHRDAAHPAMSFFFWNRTRRELALAPYGMMTGMAVFSPYLDHEVFDLLMALPPGLTLDHMLHTAAICRAYPSFADIPFEDRASAGAPHMFVARTAFDLARAVVTWPGPVRQRYALPRLAMAAVTGRSEYLWFLPLAVYLGQFDALIRTGGAAARA